MEFNPINIFGSIIVIIMLIPNIIYGLRSKNIQTKNKNKIMNIIEQIGRYASMTLMVLPLFVWKFGFSNVFMMLVYIFGNGILLMTYWIVWIFYFKRYTYSRAMTLSIVPTIIFLLNGLTLSHCALVVAAVLFGVGHIYVTHQNNKK